MPETTNPRKVLEVDSLTLRFGGLVALDDVSFDIAEGEFVTLLGPSGSGKTTLAKLLSRLMDPTSGAVRLDGVDLREVPFSSLRERVVLVPQEGFLCDASLRANLAYGRLDADDEAMRAAITELGLD